MELSGLLSNPRVDRREFSQDPEPVEHPLLDIVRAITHPSFLTRAEKLSKQIEKLLASNDKVSLPKYKPKPRQGRTLRTIKTVLLEHPDGLQTYEVRKLVEERLGRRLPKSTVKDALATHPKDFRRVSYGRYMLRSALGVADN